MLEIGLENSPFTTDALAAAGWGQGVPGDNWQNFRSLDESSASDCSFYGPSGLVLSLLQSKCGDAVNRNGLEKDLQIFVAGRKSGKHPHVGRGQEAKWEMLVQNWPRLAKQANWSAALLAKSCGVSVRTTEGYFRKAEMDSDNERKDGQV